MKRAYVIVESQSAADFLQKVLLPEAIVDVQFVPDGSQHKNPSLARSLVARRRVPTAIFMNSGSLDPELIQEWQSSTEELLRMAAASVPVEVVVAVPELESCFFAAPEVIERVLGASVRAPFIELGKRDPQGILSYLATTGTSNWDTGRAITEMHPDDIERIRATAPIQELTGFLQSLPANGANGDGREKPNGG